MSDDLEADLQRKKTVYWPLSSQENEYLFSLVVYWATGSLEEKKKLSKIQEEEWN